MHKPIKFIYALLIITIVASSVTWVILREVKKNQALTDKLQTQSNISTHPYSSLWEGKWVRENSNNFDFSEIIISTVTDRTFSVDISAQSGANSGEATAGGVFTTNTALVTSNDFIRMDDATSNKSSFADSNCLLHFEKVSDQLQVTEEHTCSYGFGFGVSAAGTYIRDGEIAHLSIKDSDIFLNKEKSYTAFTSLVGSHFELFNNTIQIEGSEEDLDNFGADISSFVVAHAFTELQSIIMLAPDDKIWAAVIDWDEPTDQPVVRYFTNVPEWKDKLPQTIDHWRAGFKKNKIIYESIK